MYKSLIPFIAGVALTATVGLAGCNANVTELEAAAQAVATAVQALQSGQATYGYVGNVASVGGKSANVAIVAGTSVTPDTAAACANLVNDPAGQAAFPAVIKVLTKAQ